MPFDWTPIAGPATGATIALLGVITTAVINFRQKQADLDRQESREVKQRLYDAASKNLEAIQKVNQSYLEYLVEAREILASIKSIAEFWAVNVTATDMTHHMDFGKDRIIRADSFIDKEKALPIYARLLIESGYVNKSILWHDFMYEDGHLTFMHTSSKEINSLTIMALAFAIAPIKFYPKIRTPQEVKTDLEEAILKIDKALGEIDRVMPIIGNNTNIIVNNIKDAYDKAGNNHKKASNKRPTR